MLGLRRFFVQRIDWKPEIFLGPSFQRTGSKMCGGSWGLNQSYIEKQFNCSRKKSMKRYFLYLIYRSIVNQSWCSYLNQFSRPFSLAIFHVFATPPISIVPFQREQKNHYTSFVDILTKTTLESHIMKRGRKNVE